MDGVAREVNTRMQLGKELELRGVSKERFEIIKLSFTYDTLQVG